MSTVAQMSLKRRVCLAGLLAVALGWAALSHDKGDEPLALDRLIKVSMPDGIEARSTAVFLTGAGGWTDEHTARAARLS